MSTLSTAAECYAWHGLRWVPRLLSLVDRNPLNPTYGCFDRQYWHYRTADFPCGMSQEFCLPLALAYGLRLPNNRWLGRERLKELALAGVDFARRSAHTDGSCDDYFPFERALGATCFALYACAETCRLLDCRDQTLLDHLLRRARFVRGCKETGRLANHQALAALAMFTVARMAGEKELETAAQRRAELALAWQNTEGWFVEYEGCDPGYLALSIDFLAKLRRASGWDFLDQPLARAVAFARDFVHPDGSYGGEYGSRNTFNYMPHGFELLAVKLPEAREIADGWLWSSMRGTSASNDDDRIFVHPAWSNLQAAGAVAQQGDRPLPEAPPVMKPGVRYYENAGLLVIHRDDWHIVVGIRKGAVFKAWRKGKLVTSDTGLVAAPLRSRKYLVTHAMHPAGADAQRLETHVDLDGQTLRAIVPFSWAGKQLATPVKQMAFRCLTGTVGRIAPNLVRKALQKVLITGRRLAPLTLERKIDWSTDTPVVTDTVTKHPGAPTLERLYRSTDATSIYVATSNAAQEGALLPWEDLSAHLGSLEKDGSMTIAREIGA